MHFIYLFVVFMADNQNVYRHSGCVRALLASIADDRPILNLSTFFSFRWRGNVLLTHFSLSHIHKRKQTEKFNFLMIQTLISNQLALKSSSSK